MTDGSVIIDTKLDKSGAEKGLSQLGNLAKKGLKTVAVGIGAVATAVTGVVTASVKARGELEQNIGGVETLFKNSADHDEKVKILTDLVVEGSPNFLKKLKESDVDKLYDYLQKKK